MSITIRKLSRVMDMLALLEGVLPHGSVIASGGEVALEFSGQLNKETHDALIQKGFVQGGAAFNDRAYVYRPR